MKRSIIANTLARLIFHSTLMLSLYLLFAGHNQPGGGFVGGLVCAAGVAVYYVVGGIDDVRRISRLAPWTILGGGLVLSTATALAPLAFDGSLLEAATVTVHAPIGDIKASTTLAFDTGVYAIVVGLIFMVFEAFGEEAEPGEARR